MNGPRTRSPIVSAELHIEAVVDGAEPREVHGRRYTPQRVDVLFRKRPGDDSYRAGWVSLYGPQIRKDGTVGTRELHEVFWNRRAEITGWPQFVRDFFWDNDPEEDR